MKQITINLEDEVYDFYSLRSAIDDLRIGDGIAQALEVLMEKYKAAKCG